MMLVAVVFGEKIQIWRMLNVAPPSAYTWSQENKVVSCLAVFFLSNTIESALIQTGAFEVEFNGVPIWSKLKTGRIPQGDELFEALNNQLKLSTGNKKLPDFSKPPTQYTPPVQKQSFEDLHQQKIHEEESLDSDDFAEFNTGVPDHFTSHDSQNKEEADNTDNEFEEFNTDRSEL